MAMAAGPATYRPALQGSITAIVTSCSQCGAALRIDVQRGVFVCDHCGSEQPVPAAAVNVELLTATTAPCPNCSTSLSTARLDGYPVLCCPGCFGLLIEMNRFTTVIAAARVSERRARLALPRRQDPGERILRCPQCLQPMISHLYAGPGNVVIDSCERCLVNWLDAGELYRIAAAPDSPPGV